MSSFSGGGYIEVPSGIDLANKSFSLSFWAKRDRENVQEWLVFQGKDAKNQGLHIGFRQNNDFSFAFYSDDLDVAVTHDQNWHHWVVTYDAATKTQQVFQDGNPRGSRTANNHLNSSGALLIGKRFESSPQPFIGNIDDLRIYNRVLSSEEISALAAGSTALPSGQATVSVEENYTVIYHANGGTGPPPPGRNIAQPSQWQQLKA